MKNILFTAFLSLVISTPSYAQEKEEKIFPDSKDVVPEMLGVDNRNEVTDILGSTVIQDKYAEEYQSSELKNLAKLYWMKSVFSFDNNGAIDNFVRISECDFYKKNFKSDFKWQKIRVAVREMIREELPTYSDKFKIIVPLDLGRYDPVKQGFPLVNETEFNSLRRVEIGGNEGLVCGLRGDIPHYPRSAYLILNKPLNYSFVKMDDHLAQAYILRNNKNSPFIPKSLRVRRFHRLAFARIRMQFMEYQGTAKEIHHTRAAVLFGKIDGIDIFENSDETGLLSSINF